MFNKIKYFIKSDGFWLGIMIGGVIVSSSVITLDFIETLFETVAKYK